MIWAEVQDWQNYIAVAVDHLRKVLSVRDNDLTWKWDDNAFDRAYTAIHLLLMYAGRHGTSTQQQVTRGTGLLHWLVHCQRVELRDKAFDVAEFLISDSHDGETKCTTIVNVNECFDIRQAEHQVAESQELGVVNIETPLHGAVFFGWGEMVMLLLHHSADVEKRGHRSGLTPYGLATKLDGLEDICIAIEDDKARTDRDGATLWDTLTGGTVIRLASIGLKETGSDRNFLPDSGHELRTLPAQDRAIPTQKSAPGKTLLESHELWK